MKKILRFLLVLALCLGTLCSCGANVEDIAGTYKIKENIYYTALADKAYNDTDAYVIKEKDGKNMLFVNHVGISGEEIEDEIGELKTFSLKKSNFDEIIFGESWKDGASEEELRKANKAAWKAEKKGGESFYVMLQNDGTVYVAAFKTRDGVKSCAYIREIVK